MTFKGHSMLLTMVPFESFGTFSYSHSIATMTVSLVVSEISSVK